MSRLLPALATSLVLLLPATASAAVTASQVTAPADGTAFVDDDTAPGDGAVSVGGTSNGTAADTVDLVLVRAGTPATLAGDVPVAADGTFTVDIPFEAFGHAAGTLRALDGTSPTLSARFAGPRVFVSEYSVSTVADGPNAGAVHDYEFDAESLRGWHDLGAAGSTGIDGSHAYGTSFEGDAEPWQAVGTYDLADEGGGGVRSALQVDGRNAYTAADVAGLYGDGPGGATDSDELAGFPALTVTTAITGPMGSYTVTEAGALVRCPVDAVAPDAAGCPALVATGIRLERTWTIAEGQVATVEDTFRSTDGAAHLVRPTLGVQTDSDETGWRIGDGAYDRYEAADVLGADRLGPAPVILTRREIDDEPADGPEGDPGSIVFHETPQQVRFHQQESFDAVYGDRGVPAGGASTLRHSFVQGFNERTAYAAAVRVADGLAAPAIAIDSPAAGATVATDDVLVTGTAADVRIASVSVNGVPALVAADGRWAVGVPLAEGENLLTAVATDGTGRTAQATRSVTFTPPSVERVLPAGVTRTLTPARDRRAPFRFRVSGRLILPKRSVEPGAACNGSMLVVVRAGKRILSLKTPRLLGNCAYRTGRFSYRSRRAIGGKGRQRLSVAVQFTGNQLLRPIKASRAAFRVR